VLQVPIEVKATGVTGIEKGVLDPRTMEPYECATDYFRHTLFVPEIFWERCNEDHQRRGARRCTTLRRMSKDSMASLHLRATEIATCPSCSETTAILQSCSSTESFGGCAMCSRTDETIEWRTQRLAFRFLWPVEKGQVRNHGFHDFDERDGPVGLQQLCDISLIQKHLERNSKFLSKEFKASATLGRGE
jgi:hypothetical protein